MVPLLEQELERRRRRRKTGGIYLMSIYHMCTTAPRRRAPPEGWIVVGVDNISEHFIYRVCSHIKDKTGEWLRKGSNSFFAYVALW